MNSIRFVQPAHRRNFRFAITAAFLLGLGVLAASRMPHWFEWLAKNALAAAVQ